jgi:hypothetical protein
MTLSSRDYAALSEDSYRDRKADPNAKVNINGVDYRVLASSDKESGYQGTIYQRLDTREIIVAHRGTESSVDLKGGQLFKDAIKADGGMVINGANTQANDAIALTQKALDLAKAEGERSGRTPTVSTTGHSLGGTLAQITAHKFDLHGETFNAYGAAGLKMGIPAGGSDVVNHVRATDLVSAASPHYGSVKVYANNQDIDALQDAGYANNRKTSFAPIIGDVRNPLEVAWDRAGPAHGISTFTGANSIMTQANLATAATYDPMIDKYRDDIGGMRSGITKGADKIRDAGEWLNQKFSQNDSQVNPRTAPLVGEGAGLSTMYASLHSSNVPVDRLDNRAIAAAVPTAASTLGGDVKSAALSPDGNTLWMSNRPSMSDPAATIASQTTVPGQLPSLIESSSKIAAVAQQSTSLGQTQATPTAEIEQPVRQAATMRA